MIRSHCSETSIDLLQENNFKKMYGIGNFKQFYSKLYQY